MKTSIRVSVRAWEGPSLSEEIEIDATADTDEDITRIREALALLSNRIESMLTVRAFNNQ